MSTLKNFCELLKENFYVSDFPLDIQLCHSTPKPKKTTQNYRAQTDVKLLLWIAFAWNEWNRERNAEIPELHASSDKCDGEEPPANVDVVSDKEQQPIDRVRPELNVHVELSPSRPWPRKCYEPGRRELGIFNHDVFDQAASQTV